MKRTFFALGRVIPKKWMLLTFMMLSVSWLNVWADDTYTPLEWIDYTGSDNDTHSNYFDTGYMPVVSTKVEFKCQGYSGYTNRWRAIFSGRTGAGNGFSIYRNGNGDKFGYFVGGYTNDYVGSFANNTDYRIIADFYSMQVNGINEQSTGKEASQYVQQTTNNITLFSGTNDWPFYGRIYYFNIYEGTTLKHAFVPVLKNGTTPCFHCTVCNDHNIEPQGSGFGYNKLTYAPVEYIEYPADGAETPVTRTFDTGYIPKANTKVEVKFMANATGNWSAIFSGRNKESGSGISLYKNGNNNDKFGYFVGNYVEDNHADFSVNTEYTAECSLGNLKVNGTDHSTTKNETAATWVATTRSITLFSNPEKDQIFRGRIYYFKIYEGDDLKHDFVPVKASDGSVGFYDRIDKKYITTRTTTDSQYFNAIGWNGSGDAIQSSIKHGGTYDAYTMLFNASYNYGAEGTGNEHYNVIVGTPAKDSSNNDWFAENYSMTDWKYGQFQTNFGDGKPADIYVRRYFVVNSSLDNQKVYMPAPHDDAPCEYYINGHKIWGETDGWNEDEIYVLTDEQKGYIHTDGTVNVFAYHVHQNWGGRYADGGLYVGGVPAARGAEFWPLEATIPIAEAMDIDVTDYRNAVNSRMYSKFRDKLYPLRTAIRMKVLDKHDNVFNGKTPAEGDFYLYNVGTGAFFCGGSDWGAHAAIGFPGIKVTLTAKEGEEGVFSINTHLNNGGNSEYLNYSGYCDTGSQDGWKFVSTGDEKSYYIKRSNNDGQMLGWNSTYTNFSDNVRTQYSYTVSTEQGNLSNDNNKWILVTEDERNALMDNADYNNGVDVSYLIKSPNFNQREDKTAWIKNGGDYHNGSREPYYIYDAYNLTYSDLHQTVTGLRPGVYKVTTTALYRKTAQQGEEIKARLYAYSGEAKENYKASTDASSVLVPNLNTGFGKAPGYDSGLGEHQNVCQAMEMGAFPQTSIEVCVGVDGNLTFGVMKEDGGDSDCTYADNWRLTYLGPVNSVPVSVSNLGKATFSSQYHLNFINTGIVPYKAVRESNDGSRVIFTKIESNGEMIVPANTGVLLVSNNGAVNTDVPVVKNAAAVEDNLMKPNVINYVLPQTESSYNNYTLGYDSDNGKFVFYLSSGSGTLAAGKAYLQLPASSNARISLTFDDETTTGISTMHNSECIMHNKVYDLSGRQIVNGKSVNGKLQRGLYIINGKKQVVK